MPEDRAHHTYYLNVELMKRVSIAAGRSSAHVCSFGWIEEACREKLERETETQEPQPG